MADRANGILLDTSAVIAHLRGRIDVLALTTPTEPLFLPLVALGELYKGAEKSARSVHNRQLVDDFLQIGALLYPDSATAESCAKTAWPVTQVRTTWVQQNSWALEQRKARTYSP
jgi:tRNA(fMet)-specific endonuclease VapC